MQEKYIFLTDNKEQSILAFDPIAMVQADIDCGIDCFQDFLHTHQDDYRFGFFTYELLSDSSSKMDRVGFPKYGFFVPKYVVELNENGVVNYLKGVETKESKEFIKEFLSNQDIEPVNNIDLKTSLTKAEYLDIIYKIQEEITKGEVEGVTFCQEFYAVSQELEPLSTYFALNKMTKAPFSTFLKWDDKHLLSASPERFLKKEGDKLISQPIKGTAKRGLNLEEDVRIQKNLLANKKELAENRMVTDMVVQEMEQFSIDDSVEIEELHQLYTFETVHQLISTVSGKLDEKTSFLEVLEIMFPMGSMTGVPKEKALDFLEANETFQRGLYSGSVGYFKPNGDYDFNVIIRSILYNSTNNTISCPVGGAITLDSIPEEEYEECLLKVNALQKVLKTNE